MSDSAAGTIERTEDVSHELVSRVTDLRFEDIPQHVVESIRRRVLDYCAAAVAAVDDDGIPELRSLVEGWGGRPESSIVGSSARVPAPLAVLVNATTGRALELDDVHEKALLHPTVATVPVALAVAEAEGGIDGRSFVTALAGAQEAMCRLGLAPEYHVAGDKHRPRGMSYTYQCGVLGGALAAGRVLGLDREGMLDAFGNAFTAIAGNQQAILEGVLAIRVQQGVTAQTALQSAYFARAGITGPRQPLEGKFGWLSYWHAAGYDRDEVTADFGERWEAANVSIKPYPVCRITHNSVTATMQVMEAAGVRPADVARITLHVNSRESWEEVVEPLEQRRAPRTSMEAQFSLPFVCAVAAVKGTIRLEDVAESALEDPEVLAMVAKIEPVLDEGSDVSGGRVMPMPVEADLETVDGSVFHARSDHPLGHPRNPMGWDEVVDKLRTCARWSGDARIEQQVDAIVETVAGLTDLGDVSVLAEALAVR